MGFSFFENMQGHLVDKKGETHRIDFDLKAEASHVGRLFRDGNARITGIVRALPWAEDAALEGTVRISPRVHRSIEYNFSFKDDEGLGYSFWGKKTLNYLRLVQSMTNMEAKLSRNGEIVASGKMTFDLNDLPNFATGWTPTSSIRALDLAGPQSADTPNTTRLSLHEQETLQAYAEAIIVPGRHVPPVGPETTDKLLELLSYMPPQILLAYRAVLHTLDATARIRYGRPFKKLTHKKRSALVARFERGGFALKSVNVVLSMPVKTAHFGRRDYLDSFDFPTFESSAREPQPRYMQNVMAPEQLEEETVLPADVVIIGSGAGGGPMAALLAEKGLAVAIVEEGRYQQRTDFSGSPEQRMFKFWRNAGMLMTVGNLPIPIPTGKLVGGTTAINSGTCFTTPDEVLQEWRRDHGFPSDFGSEAFRPFLDSAMEELQVTQAQPKWLGEVAHIVAKGADALNAPHHGPLPRNAPECDGQGMCTLGCPTDAKRSTNVSYVPRALRAGAHLFTGLPVTRILQRGRRAVSVEAQGTDQYGAPRRLRIQARAVVVAAGTLASPLLLKDNGVDLPWLGRNLSIHPSIGMVARSDKIRKPWAAIPQGYGVEGLVDPRVRFEGFYAPPQLSAPMYPFFGEELTRWMDMQDQVSQYAFMVRDRNVGSVQHGLHGRPLIRYDLTPDVLELCRKASATLAEMLLLGGAEEVVAPIGNLQTLTQVEQAREIAKLPLKAHHFRAMAFHPLGTCRMGPDAERAVVDFEHRVFGTDNLYVVDGSVVPTSLGVNPQITIMAMAERAAGLLADRLS